MARLVVTDPDLAKVLPALNRAEAAAWRPAVETATPFYVLENGRVVDRNAGRKGRGAKRADRTERGRASGRSRET